VILAGIVLGAPWRVEACRSWPRLPIDTTLHRAALKSDHWRDLSAARSAPIYNISARLDARARLLRAEMALSYANPASTPLHDLRLVAWPNLPFFNTDLNVSDVRVNGAPVIVSVDGPDIGVPLPDPLAPGRRAELALHFELALPDTVASFNGRFGYDAATGVYSLPHWFPIVPVHAGDWVVNAGPEWGDLGYSPAAFFRVEVTAPAELALAASGVETGSRVEADGSRTWTLVGGPMRDLALFLGSFETIDQEVDGARVRSHYLPGDAVGGTEALRYAAQALAIFGQRFGPYPYSELDVVEGPYSAMEYPGLIELHRHMYSPQRSDYAVLEIVAAHEVAHQWWYGLVINDQVAEPWLDEGLATYSEELYVDAYPAAASARRSRIASAGPGAEGVDFRQPASRYARGEYVPIVYFRTARSLGQLYESLGGPAFDALLQEYVTRYRYRPVTGKTFLDLVHHRVPDW
jgi:hypothetical protein